MPDICNERDFRLAVAALKRGIVSVEDCLSAFHTQANVSTQSLAEHLISNRLITPEILDELSHSLEPNTQSDPVLSQFDAIGRPAAEKELRFDLADSLASDHDQSTIDYRTRDVSPRYTVRRHLADGGLGRVLVAWDRDLHREVAVKEMKSCSPDTLRRFLLEAKVTGQLEHPNIVPVYELVQSPNDEYKPFYAMRLIHGRTLEAEIRQRHSEKTIYRDPIILNRLLQAFLGVCNAIEFAHHRNIIHRDIKPRNIVLGGFGEVIVLDWGLVKTLGEQQGSTVPISDQSDSGAPESTVDGQILGTIAYAAPEQVTGLVSQIDQRTDVFALGATLFAILTGHPPFGRHVGSQVESSASEPAPP